MNYSVKGLLRKLSQEEFDVKAHQVVCEMPDGQTQFPVVDVFLDDVNRKVVLVTEGDMPSGPVGEDI
jgi:hypothetical protein